VRRMNSPSDTSTRGSAAGSRSTRRKGPSTERENKGQRRGVSNDVRAILHHARDVSAYRTSSRSCANAPANFDLAANSAAFTSKPAARKRTTKALDPSADMVEAAGCAVCGERCDAMCCSDNLNNKIEWKHARVSGLTRDSTNRAVCRYRPVHRTHPSHSPSLHIRLWMLPRRLTSRARDSCDDSAMWTTTNEQKPQKNSAEIIRLCARMRRNVWGCRATPSVDGHQDRQRGYNDTRNFYSLYKCEGCAAFGSGDREMGKTTVLSGVNAIAGHCSRPTVTPYARTELAEGVDYILLALGGVHCA
jgi:hypothetical protein